MDRLEVGKTYRVFCNDKHIDTIKVTKLNFDNYYVIGQSTITGQMMNYSYFDNSFQDVYKQMIVC